MTNFVNLIEIFKRLSFVLYSRQIQFVDGDDSREECTHRVPARAHRVGDGDRQGAPDELINESHECLEANRV